MPQSPAQARPERNVYSVSRLNREVRILIEQGLAVIWVEGELSNLSQPGSGHWYFSLKDRDAQVRCAMFRTRNLGIGFTPRAGQHVLARGRVSLYEPRGEFQLIVEHLEEAGIGVLKREFERLKAKLAAEGLFAQERKRALPRFPRRIGVVTSPTGAALRDVLHILERRFPPARVLIYPAAVQGAAAAPALVAALQLASARQECDVLILARGGGSLEDLWAFNEERVARAIHASTIPVVAGVGHEIDFTIADFVADARAPTPSGAAELVAPDRNACLEALAKTEQRLAGAARRELRTCSQRLAAIAARLRQTHPGVRVEQQTQRLDDLEQRLNGALRGCLHRYRTHLSEAMERLTRESPERHVRAYCARQDALGARLQNALQRRLASALHRTGLAQRALHAVSPLATLERGFAVVTRAADGSLITDARALSAGEAIRARLAHGSVLARVIERIDEEPPNE
jgi:exodeoxyribonuclease VII large subunit